MKFNSFILVSWRNFHSYFYWKKLVHSTTDPTGDNLILRNHIPFEKEVTNRIPRKYYAAPCHAA